MDEEKWIKENFSSALEAQIMRTRADALHNTLIDNVMAETSEEEIQKIIEKAKGILLSHTKEWNRKEIVMIPQIMFELSKSFELKALMKQAKENSGNDEFLKKLVERAESLGIFMNIPDPKRLFMPDGKTPRCTQCGKPMKRAVDEITNKISDYDWEFDCPCIEKHPDLKKLRLHVG